MQPQIWHPVTNTNTNHPAQFYLPTPEPLHTPPPPPPSPAVGNLLSPSSAAESINSQLNTDTGGLQGQRCMWCSLAREINMQRAPVGNFATGTQSPHSPGGSSSLHGGQRSTRDALKVQMPQSRSLVGDKVCAMCVRVLLSRYNWLIWHWSCAHAVHLIYGEPQRRGRRWLKWKTWIIPLIQ